MAEVDGSEAVEEEGGEEEAFSSLRRLWSSASACSSRVRARVFLGIAVGGGVWALWTAASFVNAFSGISFGSSSLFGVSLFEASLPNHPISSFVFDLVLLE